jgi:hypothetical protein
VGIEFAIRRLGPDEARAAVSGLAEVLVDCVTGGASVSFMAPLDLGKAVDFWNGVAEAVARGERALLVAETVREGEGDDGGIVGTVQVVWRSRKTSRIGAMSPNCWFTGGRGARGSVRR